jgi:excisionase family DNA binding protein
MRKNAYSNSEHTQQHTQVLSGGSMTASELPNRLMTAFEVAEFVGCHEETIRRAYWRGLLTSQRFGVRGRRFRPSHVLDWIERGTPTRVS